MLRFNPLLRGARVATTKKESSVLRRTGFNPLLRGARVATHRTVRTVRQLRVASIPYFAGHALQPARPVSRLPRTWRSPRFNPLLRGARVATHRRRTTWRGLHWQQASIPYFAGHALQRRPGRHHRGRRAASIPYFAGHALQRAATSRT